MKKMFWLVGYRTAAADRETFARAEMTVEEANARNVILKRKGMAVRWSSKP
jgi:hypothetical protein